MASNSGNGSGNDNNHDSTEGSAPRDISVLFVCLGNICRSTMAEAVFRHITTTTSSSSSSHPRISISKIDSAGTASYHAGSEPDPRTISTLVDNGIENYSHVGRQVTLNDFVEFDYILAMDRENLQDLQRLASSRQKKGPVGSEGGAQAQVMLFGDFGGVKGEEVVDPYYGARDGFDVAYKQMVRFTDGFIKQVGG